MRITKLLLGVILTAAVTVAQAEEYRMIVSFPAGSQTDTVARMIQKSIERTTKDTIVIENVPGADQVIGAVKFKNDPRYDVILGTSGQNVFGPILKTNPGFGFEDFDHALYIGSTPGVWVVPANSPIRTPRDLAEKMPDLVGGYAPSYNYNVQAMNRAYNLKSVIVPYKGGNEVLIDIINGSLKIGMVAVTPNLIQFVKDGKLRIVGNMTANDVVVDGVAIPSVPKRLNVAGFNGFLGVDLRPDASPERKQHLKKIIWAAINDPETADLLRKIYVLPDASNDPVHIQNFYSNYRARVRAFSVQK